MSSDSLLTDMCEWCMKIPQDDIFQPSNINGNGKLPMVSSFPVDHISANSRCHFCVFPNSIRTRLGRNEWDPYWMPGSRSTTDKPWVAPINPRYSLCSFRPPRGMLWPLPPVVCTVVSIECGNDKDDADFRKWCSDPDCFPWSIAEFVELCVEKRVRQVTKVGSNGGQGHRLLCYGRNDLEELRRWIAKSTPFDQDRKDKRLCDIVPGFKLIDCQNRSIVSPNS